MKETVLALDLSNKPGWAYFEDGNLLEYNTVFLDETVADFGEYPFNYLKMSEHVLNALLKSINHLKYDESNKNILVIEETTTGRNNYSQKQLEFLHCKLLQHLEKININHKIKYIRTGVWRRTVGATQSKEERNYNAMIARQKRKTGKRLAKIDGKVARRLDRKDYALSAFKRHFGIELPRKMNDACDAALVGLAYIKGASVCDGTVRGGL